ncbi:MAG: DNA-binding GntR family transcriptional regulator [Pirellulaceae bacterium]|jgi:DNA-binding GntR family transcriptional regulator
MTKLAETRLTSIEQHSGESLAESVYESLLEGIIVGQLCPGMFLSAAKLSEKLEVSRTPIHDALWMLAGDGLVEIQPGRRARVSKFGRDDVWEVFEMRKYLEGLAAELAAGRMDERQFRPLRSAAEDLKQQSVDWTLKWSAFDEQFHQVIAESSGNRRLADDIARYRLLHRGFNRVSADYESLQQALQEHLEILAALETHDSQRARAAMSAHIGNWQVYFVEKFHE